MIQVTKRDGSKEPLDLNKLHKVVSFACEGITGVSISEVEIKSNLQFYPNIKATDIQETLIKSAADLITEENPNYQYVASRLLSYHLRKEVYGKYEPDKLFAHYKKVKQLGFYDTEIEEAYTPEEWAQLNSYVKHSRDDLLAYAGMAQFRDKYLVKDKVSGKILETPQMALMLIAMTLFSQDQGPRVKLVKEFYDAVSTFQISLPTPIMAGVRTPLKQFSSCVLIDSDDSLKSINATSSAVVEYVAKRAGIGIGATKLRAHNDPVGSGAVLTDGSVPFIQMFEKSVNSCNQGGLRKGSATVNILGWHLDYEKQVVLKNKKGVDEDRAYHMDYCVQINRLFYERLLNEGNITLFSPAEHPEMYNAFYSKDYETFKVLYEKAERSRCRKKVISAREWWGAYITERLETGRIYLFNADNVNIASAYKDLPVVMSNLCVAGETKVDVIVDSVPFYGLDIKSLIQSVVDGKECFVKSYNGEEAVYKKVTAAALTNPSAKVLKLKYKGKELILTPEHKVFTKNRGYVMAKDLLPKDELIIS